MHNCDGELSSSVQAALSSTNLARNAYCIVMSKQGLAATLSTPLQHQYAASELLVLEGVCHYDASELGRLVQALFLMGAQVRGGQGHRRSRSIGSFAARFICEPIIMFLVLLHLRTT